MTPKQLREQRANVAEEIKRLASLAHDENRDFTAEEQEKWQAANADYNRLSRLIETAERQQEIDAQLAEVAVNQPTNIGRRDVDDGEPRERVTRSGLRLGIADPSIDLETRDRALRAWMKSQLGEEPEDDELEAARECRIRPHAGILRVPLFNTRDWLAIPRYENGKPMKRAQSTAATEGAELIPEGFVPRLERAMLAFGGMLQVSEVMRTATGNDLPWPTADDTSNKGQILAENAAVSEQDVVFGALTLEAYKYTSDLVRVSMELIQDSAISISDVLGDMLGERLGRILNEHFTTGTGVSQPRGIEVAAPIGVTTAPAGSWDEDDVLDLIHSVDPAYRGEGRFLMHDSIIAETRKLKDSNGAFLWQPSLQLGQPDRLAGYPITVNQDMDSTSTTGDDVAIFGALRKYKVRQVAEVRLRRLVERYADNDQEGFVAFIRADGDLLDAGTGPVKKARVG